jgi:hypothetical protein
MIEKLLNKILPKRVIVNCDHDPYLHRWYLFRSGRFGIFIHKFVRSDEDRALHDHPWSFLVIPLWRGYREHNQKGVRNVLPLLGTRFRRAEYQHRVELRAGKPSWSLFIRFRKRREWGFWDKVSGFILWNKWWQDKCE